MTKHCVVIVTALPVEYLAVRAHLTDISEDEHEEGDVYERGLFYSGEHVWEVGIVEMGSGNPNAAQKTERAIAYFKPDAVLFVGVAGGIKDVTIGDVVIATKVYGYHSGKADDEFKVRPEIGLPNHRFKERACAEARKSDWLIRLTTVPDPVPHVFYGPIAAGEQVVASTQSESYKLIRNSYSDALAVEMESYGFLKAAQAHSGLEALVVRGISDLIEGKLDADRSGSQERASRHAAAFSFEVLSKLILPDKNVRIETHEIIREVPLASIVSIRSTLPTQPYFFGRVEELKTIASALLPETRAWGALIDGPGGIGKTALAIRAAINAEGFEHKIFITAKVRELTAEGDKKLTDFTRPTYLAMLDELGRELGIDGLEKLPPDDRPNELRLVLAGKKALIIFDNLETLPEDERTRLYQFLSRLPEGNKAIVTSRRRTDVDARIVRLDRLAKDEALELIAELATKYPRLDHSSLKEREDLYEITQGNPLFIRWIAGQLGRENSKCRTIAEACAYIDKTPKGNDPLEYIFGDLLENFSDDETKVLAALTYFNLPAKPKWIADMTDLPERAVETALEDLTDRSVLTSDPSAQAYFLPPLTAKFIRTRRPETVTQTGDALVNRTFALVVQYGGDDNFDGFHTLDEEWYFISIALPSLLKGDNYSLQIVCSELSQFLNFTGRWDEWLWLQEQAEVRANFSGDKERAGWRAYTAGYVYSLRNQPVEVLACAERAAEYWQDSIPRNNAFAIQLHGLSFELDNDFSRAILSYREALEIMQHIAVDSKDAAIILISLANAESGNNDFESAYCDYKEALRIAKKVNYQEGIVYITCSLAEIALNHERWVEAESLAREGLALAEKVGRQELIASDCHFIAKALLKQKINLYDALTLCSRSVEIMTRLRYRELPEAKETLAEIEQALSKE
jgi:nucleoside phosphorylase/tetratricopeptide (TPR) repeat protein